MTTNTESDTYNVDNILPGPIQKLYSPTAKWYTKIFQDKENSKNTLNWMLMVKDNIDNNETTVTLLDDTVVRYTGGCILHNCDYKSNIHILYSYLAVTSLESTLIITDESMIKKWVNTNTGKFKFIGMKCCPIYSLHDTKCHKTVSANIIVTTIDIFTEIINPSPNLSKAKRSALSNLRNKKWCNLVIDTFVSSELVNNIIATYKWVVMSEASLSQKAVQNMMNIIFPHQHDQCINNYSYILPSVVMNSKLGLDELSLTSKICVENIYGAVVPVNTLDPLQNSEREVKDYEDVIDKIIFVCIASNTRRHAYIGEKGIICVNV